MPALVVTDGPLAGRRFELAGELVVGREAAPITIDDPELSRRHALVRLTGDGLEIEDLGSLNGTFVNGGKIIGVTQLAHGDALRLGTTSLEVDLAAAPPRESEAGARTVLSKQPPGAD